jgi:hypothetical protein
MAGKLKRLSGTTQEALKQLACLGNAGEIAPLATVYGTTEEVMHAALWDAVHAGLVFREDSAYKFVDSDWRWPQASAPAKTANIITTAADTSIDSTGITTSF